MAKDDDLQGKKTAGYTPAEAERFGVVLEERPPDSEATIVTASPNVKPELLPKGLKGRLYEGDLSSDPRKIRDVRGVVADPAPPPAAAPPYSPPPASPGAAAPPWAMPASPPPAHGAPRRAPEQPITTRTKTRNAPGTIVISTTQLVLAVLVFALVVVAAAGFVGYSLGRSNH